MPSILTRTQRLGVLTCDNRHGRHGLHQQHCKIMDPQSADRSTVSLPTRRRLLRPTRRGPTSRSPGPARPGRRPSRHLEGARPAVFREVQTPGCTWLKINSRLKWASGALLPWAVLDSASISSPTRRLVGGTWSDSAIHVVTIMTQRRVSSSLWPPLRSTTGVA